MSDDDDKVRKGKREGGPGWDPAGCHRECRWICGIVSDPTQEDEDQKRKVPIILLFSETFKSSHPLVVCAVSEGRRVPMTLFIQLHVDRCFLRAC